MKYKVIAAFILTCIFTKNCVSQFYITLNNELNFIAAYSLQDSLNFHPEIRPQLLTDFRTDSSTKNKNFKVNRPETFLSPIVDFSSSVSNSTNICYSSNIGVRINYNPIPKLHFNINSWIEFNKFQPYYANKIDSNNTIPLWGRFFKRQDNLIIQPLVTGILSYVPKKYLWFDLGIDKQFVGDGYRSLLLSDNAAPYPFLKLNLNIWKMRYFSFVAYLKDIDNKEFSTKLYDKYGVFHYLSVNLTKRLSFGIFESVIWNGQDSTMKRGLDPAYLNPIIFFRPVEYSMHSPDNASMGGNIHLLLWNKTLIYSQLFLDDLMVKELFSQSGWWGNKYGIQIGLKCYNTLNINKLFSQFEYNTVRPYTYAHSSSLNNYGNIYSPLAHPFGANFKEFITQLKYSKNKWIFSGKIITAVVGKDTGNINVGQNIYKSFDQRYLSYKTFITQGIKQTVAIADVKISYLLIPKWNIVSFVDWYYYYNSKILGLGYNTSILSIGVSTLLYNNDIDY